MAPSLTRRTFFSLLGASAVALSAAPARAGLERKTTDALGTTLTLTLASAPFPCAGAGYTDPSVWVFVPAHFRASPGREIPLLVHFHGHSTTAERAMINHKLREQLVASLQDAILVVPQGPVMASDSSFGKLEAPGAFSRMIREVLSVLGSSELVRGLGTTAFRGSRPGRTCISAHSGGYHAAAQCLRHGGLEINEVYLFDALYADVDVFRDWVLAGRGKPLRSRHKLVSYTAGGTTERMNDWLFGELEKGGASCARELVEGTLSRETLSRSEAVFIKTSTAHNGVAFETSALRDCLYASALPRHVRTSWFLAKGGSRPIERMR